MKIVVIGAGRIGGTLTKLWAKKGHQIVISSSHSDKLNSLVRAIGSRYCSGTFEDTAKFGEAVLLAIPLGVVNAVSAKIKSHLTSKIVLNAINHFTERHSEIAFSIINRKIASGQTTQKSFSSTRIVRAFSSIKYSDLQEQSNQAPVIAAPYSTISPMRSRQQNSLSTIQGLFQLIWSRSIIRSPLTPAGFCLVKHFQKSR